MEMADGLDFLISHGMSLEEIHRLMDHDDFTLEQIVESAKRIVERGESLTPDHQEWEEPIPFDVLQTPGFPLEVLPAPFAAFAEALAESTQTPTEMAGILSLGVLATAFQSKYEVQVTPDWREPLCLYPVAVAEPGERKSAVLAALTGPISEYEAEQRELEAAELAQNETERDLLEKALAAAKASAVKGKGNAAARKQEALELSAQLAAFQTRQPFRLLVDDVTPEKLIDLMHAQGGCITVCSSEGGVFDAMAGRYDRSANFDVYLKGHSGDRITVDRIGRSANSLPKPRLTMLLTIQPEVLHGLMDNATFRGRGLCGRFLYAMCRSRVGRRKVAPAPVPERVRAAYRQLVRQMLSSQGAGTVRLSPEADEIRREYQRFVEAKLANEWEHMRDWGGKLVGAMVRIAALLHLASFPAAEPISAETMAGATSIAEFLGAHAMAAYQMMGADKAQEDAKYLWRRLEGTGQSAISRRDLFNLCKGKFKRVEHMTPGLRVLVSMGYIREEDQTTGGRPSKKIILNPLRKSRKSSKRVPQNGSSASQSKSPPGAA